jgi:hypothetical protein
MAHIPSFVALTQNDIGQFVRPGLAEEIAELECDICMEPLDDWNNIVFTCDEPHVYHVACLLEWVKHNPRDLCPQCKTPTKPMSQTARAIVDQRDPHAFMKAVDERVFERAFAFEVAGGMRTMREKHIRRELENQVREYQHEVDRMRELLRVARVREIQSNRLLALEKQENMRERASMRSKRSSDT